MARIPGLQRLFDGLALHDAGRDVFDGAIALGFDRALAVDRLTPSALTTRPEQCLADRDRRDAAGTAHFIAFANLLVPDRG